LLCFLPATFEIAAYVLLGTLVLKMDVLSAAILGTVMGAASSAVIVPSMLKIQEEGYGNTKKYLNLSPPQLRWKACTF